MQLYFIIMFYFVAPARGAARGAATTPAKGAPAAKVMGDGNHCEKT